MFNVFSSPCPPSPERQDVKRRAIATSQRTIGPNASLIESDGFSLLLAPRGRGGGGVNGLHPGVKSPPDVGGERGMEREGGREEDQFLFLVSTSSADKLTLEQRSPGLGGCPSVRPVISLPVCPFVSPFCLAART